MTPNAPPPLVVVDDDSDVCDMLSLLAETVQRTTIPFVDPRDFLTWLTRERPAQAVAVIDIRMPPMSGLELMQRAESLDSDVRFVIMTGFSDVNVAVDCMKRGAVDFLEKPFSQQRMIDAITRAYQSLEAASPLMIPLTEARDRFERLTPRQRDVLVRVARGDANKMVAFELGISTKTVEIHRGEVMRRMEADSLAELVRSVVVLEQAGILDPHAVRSDP